RVAVRRDQHAVRDDVVLTGQPGRSRVARMRRDGDAVVDPVGEESPHRFANLHPAECTGGAEGAHDGYARERQRGDADRRRHRLVQVDDVELLELERPAYRRHRARRQHDVGKRTVCRNDHRAADRNDVRRWMTVPPEPWVQNPREAAGRVVTHDRPRLDPACLQRLRLQPDLLDARAPERPRVRRDDADLHPTSKVWADWSNIAAYRAPCAEGVVYVST